MNRSSSLKEGHLYGRENSEHNIVKDVVLKFTSTFVQIWIEGNIASGKTTCLEYFSKTSDVEVIQ